MECVFQCLVLIELISFSDTKPSLDACYEVLSLSMSMTLISLEVCLVLILDDSFDGWGVSGVVLSKLLILLNNSLLLSPISSLGDFCFLSSLNFCLAFLLTLKGLNKGFSIGTWKVVASWSLGLVKTFYLRIDSPNTWRFIGIISLPVPLGS